MRTQRSTQWLGLVLVGIVAGVLYDDAPRLGPPWVVLWVTVSVWRFRVMQHYEREILPRPAQEHLDFFRRQRAVWPATALVWGLTTLLYFDRAPLGDQYICWLTMAGLAMFSVHGLSTQLATMR